MTNLTRTDIDSLRECAVHNNRGNVYSFRPRTMERLEKEGLVESYQPSGRRRTAYRLTRAGHQVLDEERGS